MIARLCRMAVLLLLGGCTGVLVAPKPIEPKDGANFHHFPRTTELRWAPVEGAASYAVEVDCFHCCNLGKWCTEGGKPKLNASEIKATSFRFDWIGMNLG